MPVPVEQEDKACAEANELDESQSFHCASMPQYSTILDSDFGQGNAGRYIVARLLTHRNTVRTSHLPNPR